ncbi:MAG: CDP-alcohol phosphatidyltransferase family protein [Verrucomicrobiae bacterium]|nr:CDP-alcohol phosphatidyltransferase family protein [Verrucomicrobiae bacterium]
MKTGVRPNQVSVFSVVFAVAGVSCLWLREVGMPHWLAWLACAAGIQLRLLCNLMDGMLAIEGGLRSPNGDLYNEAPDRLADTVILAGIGMASGTEWARNLGWLAACGALSTAWTRSHGASLLGRHDFRGPMAKPHRMALATGLCLVLSVLDGRGGGAAALVWGLGAMNAGIAITLIRRLRGISRDLRAKTTTSAESSTP